VADQSSLAAIARIRGSQSTPRPARPATAQRPTRPPPNQVGSRGGSDARRRRISELADLLSNPSAGYQVAPAPAPRDESEGKSLFGQVGSLVAGIPRGVAGLLGDAAVTAAAPIRVPYDAMRGDFDTDNAGDRYIPLANEFKLSVDRTLDRGWTTFQGITEGDPLRAYLDESDNSNLIGALVEDIGNVAIAGSATSRLLGSTSRAVTVPVRAASAVAGAVTPLSGGAAALRAAAEAPLIPAGRGGLATAARVTGDVIPLERTVTLPGRGLAGMVERSGAPEAAQAIASTGRRVRSVARLGERAAHVPAAPYAYAARGLSTLVEGTTGARPSAWIGRAAERAVSSPTLARVVYPFTEEGRSVGVAQAEMQRERTAATRQALASAKLADEYGLTADQASAVMFTVDQRLYPVIEAINAGDLPADQIDAVVTRMYEGVEPEMRPTPAQVREAAAYAARTGDPDLLAKMDQVRDLVVADAERRTRARLDSGDLNPEQVDADLRPTVIDAVRRREERARDRIQKDWEKESDAAYRAERIADAQEAINWTLPMPRRAEAAFADGVRAGKKEARADAAVREHGRTIRALQQAVDAYVRADGRAPVEVTRAAAEVDRLTVRAAELEQIISRDARRGDAAAALSRASGEFRPGPARVLEGFRDGEPVVGQTKPGSARPDVDASALPVQAQIRARAKEVAGPDVVEAEGAVASLLDGETVYAPPPRRKPAGMSKEMWAEAQSIRQSGVWDWWDALSEAERARLLREKWVQPFYVQDGGASSWRRQGVTADVVAETIGRRVGAQSVDQALGAWMAAVRNAWDATGSDRVIGQLADEFGLAPDVVRSALRNRVEDYVGTATDVAVAAMDDLAVAVERLDAEARALFDETVAALDADPDATVYDLMEAVEALVPDVDLSPEGPLAVLPGVVDLGAVLRWVRDGDPQPFMRAVGARLDAAQYRQLGSMAGRQAGNRGRLAGLYADQQRARKSLTIAENKAARDQARRGTAVDRASEAEQQAAARAGRAAEDAETAARPSISDLAGDARWRRRGDSRAPGERDVLREGRLRERASARRAKANRLESRMVRANEKVADIPNELGRSFQDRLRDDINRPAISGLRAVARRAGDRLGRLTDNPVTDGPAVDGAMATIARRYGIYDDLVAALVEMDADVNVPLGAADYADAILGILADRRVTLDPPDGQYLNDAINTAQLLEDIDARVRDDALSGLSANTPYRVIDLLHKAQWMPDDLKAQWKSRVERYEKRRAAHLTRLMDDQARAMPARFRTVAGTARREVRALLDMAEELNRQSAGAGDALIRIAEDAPTTLATLTAQGVDPTHLIGGRTVDRPTTGGSGRLRTTPVRADYERTTDLGPTDLTAYSRLAADQAARIIGNDLVAYVHTKMGRRADDVLRDVIADHEAAWGEPMTPGQMTAAARDAGYVPATGSKVTGRDTVLIPKILDDHVRAVARPSHWTFEALRRVNRAFKTLVLPLSPKWMLGNIIGNALQAGFYAGVGPVQLARQMIEMTRMEGGTRAMWQMGGLPSWAPEEIASHGLTYGEHQLLNGGLEVETARTVIGRTVARSYNLNEFVDNMTRSSVYLAKLRDGVPTDQALRSALDTMGDFTRLTPFERRYVREVLPFYPWLRHQTTAMMRLPINSPVRAAYLLHLSDLYSEDGFTDEMLRMLGSRIPVGGGNYLNLGSVSPFADPARLAFSPTEIGRSLTPAFKLPLAATVGINADRGFQPLTRPASTMRRGAYGQEAQTSPLTRLFSDPIRGVGELGYLTAGAVPYVRSIRDVALGPEEARYATGYEVSAAGRPVDTGRTRLSAILAGLNLPTVEQFDADEIARRQAEQRRRQRG
jgi:hypothetical protein